MIDYIKKIYIFSLIEFYLPYCVTYYDDIIKNMTCRQSGTVEIVAILYVTYLPFGDWHPQVLKSS